MKRADVAVAIAPLLSRPKQAQVLAALEDAGLLTESERPASSGAHLIQAVRALRELVRLRDRRDEARRTFGLTEAEQHAHAAAVKRAWKEARLAVRNLQATSKGQP